MFKWRDDDRTPHRLAVPRLAAPIRPSAARNGATAPGGAAEAADLAVQGREASAVAAREAASASERLRPP